MYVIVYGGHRGTFHLYIFSLANSLKHHCLLSRYKSRMFCLVVVRASIFLYLVLILGDHVRNLRMFQSPQRTVLILLNERNHEPQRGKLW
jgi:hypothetical protein